MKDIHHLDSRIVKSMENAERLFQNGDLGFASAPSNIAFMKYWGKKPNQSPANSSLSMTLGDFRSTTKIRVMGRSDGQPTAPTQVMLNGTLRDDKKLLGFIDRLTSSWRGGASFNIETVNNFPTACGIASSASGYAALVGAFADLLQINRLMDADEAQAWISHWARMGSGSASRSTLLDTTSPFVAWTVDNRIFKVPTNFGNMRHCVVIVDRNEKSISSSAGHEASTLSPLQDLRLAGAESKFRSLLSALQCGDFQALAAHTEAEATAMHAVMMTSGNSSHCYLTEKTLAVIRRVVANRGPLPVLWTLDAGSNPHFSYLSSADGFMQTFLQWCQSESLEVLQNKTSTGLMLGHAK